MEVTNEIIEAPDDVTPKIIHTAVIKTLNSRDADGNTRVFFEDGLKKTLEHKDTTHYVPVPGDVVVFTDDGNWQVMKKADYESMSQTQGETNA